MTKIYVGRWNLLPDSVEGYNGLVEMDRKAVVAELAREMDIYDKENPVEDSRMGVYTPKEFEEEFNQTLENHFNSKDYWIRII